MRTARRVCDRYFKATSDADGAILLYIELIDETIALVQEFGWDDSAVYSSLYRAGEAAAKLVPQSNDRAALTSLRDRLNAWMDPKIRLHGCAEDAIGAILYAIDQRLGANTGGLLPH